MIDPPIDKLIKKAPCRYALVCGLAKRAKELSSTKAAELEEIHVKPISFAAEEIYEDKISIKID